MSRRDAATDSGVGGGVEDETLLNNLGTNGNDVGKWKLGALSSEKSANDLFVIKLHWLLDTGGRYTIVRTLN